MSPGIGQRSDAANQRLGDLTHSKSSPNITKQVCMNVIRHGELLGLAELEL